MTSSENAVEKLIKTQFVEKDRPDITLKDVEYFLLEGKSLELTLRARRYSYTSFRNVTLQNLWKRFQKNSDIQLLLLKQHPSLPYVLHKQPNKLEKTKDEHKHDGVRCVEELSLLINRFNELRHKSNRKYKVDDITFANVVQQIEQKIANGGVTNLQKKIDESVTKKTEEIVKDIKKNEAKITKFSEYLSEEQVKIYQDRKGKLIKEIIQELQTKDKYKELQDKIEAIKKNVPDQTLIEQLNKSIKLFGLIKDNDNIKNAINTKGGELKTLAKELGILSGGVVKSGDSSPTPALAAPPKRSLPQQSALSTVRGRHGPIACGRGADATARPRHGAISKH